MNIIVKRYEHFNSAMGKYISSKRHYDNEMAKGGYVSYEEGCRMADKVKTRDKKYELSPKARAIIASAKGSADKKGNIKQSDRLITGMKEIGVSFGITDNNKNILPKHYQEQGGFKEG